MANVVQPDHWQLGSLDNDAEPPREHLRVYGRAVWLSHHALAACAEDYLKDSDFVGLRDAEGNRFCIADAGLS